MQVGTVNCRCGGVGFWWGGSLPEAWPLDPTFRSSSANPSPHNKQNPCVAHMPIHFTPIHFTSALCHHLWRWPGCHFFLVNAFCPKIPNRVHPSVGTRCLFPQISPTPSMDAFNCFSVGRSAPTHHQTTNVPTDIFGHEASAFTEGPFFSEVQRREVRDPFLVKCRGYVPLS